MYSLLFKASSETLLMLALDKKFCGSANRCHDSPSFLGTKLKFSSPCPLYRSMCGGLSPSGCSFMRSRKKFFIPVRVLSQVFRGKFLFYLKKAFDDYQLKFSGESLPPYSNESGFLSLIASLYDTPPACLSGC
jgi:hypothetical protein